MVNMHTNSKVLSFTHVAADVSEFTSNIKTDIMNSQYDNSNNSITTGIARKLHTYKQSYSKHMPTDLWQMNLMK